MKKTTKFDAIRFLEALEETCVSASREGKQFLADPWELGPRITSTLKALRVSSMYCDAVLTSGWAVAQSEDDSRWRVFDSRNPTPALEGQKDGYESAEEALNHAIIHHELSAARRKLRNSSEITER
jgi:hypothetical protein